MDVHELKFEQAEQLLKKHGSVVTAAAIAAVKEAFRLGSQVDLMKVAYKKENGNGKAIRK